MGKESIRNLSDAQILALTIYGEARGESAEGKIAVGSVILEREKRKKYGKGISGVCLKKWQFSCFNEADPNYKKLLSIIEQWDGVMATNYQFNNCYGIAEGLLDSRIEPNITATHYHTLKSSPYWKDKLKYVGTIGNHKFYLEA